MRFGVHCRLWTMSWTSANLDLIDHAKAIGFDVFEISLLNLPAVDPVAIRRRAEAAGIWILGMMALPKDKSLATPDAAVRRNTVAFLKASVERAREMGSELLGGMVYAVPGRFSGRRPTAEEIRWIVEGLAEVATHAQRYGVTLAVEPVNRYET
jgi:D-psicose/D-tagatose/L-ribulose 3-epimerase